MPQLSMRSVVSGVSAMLVVVVVAVTFTATYFTGLEAIDSVGRSYSLAVVGAAKYQVAAYFDYPARRLESVGRMIRLPGMMLPTDDPTKWGTLEAATKLLLAFQLETLGDAALANILFDDGSRATTTNLDVVIARSMLHAGAINNTVTRCCSERFVIEHFVGNLSVNTGELYVGSPTLTDGRVGLYGTLRTLLFGATTGIWQSPVLVHFPRFMTAPAFELPAIFPLRNSSDHFLGVVIGSYSVANIDGFLRNVKPTAGSEAFAVDRVGAMLASTHTASYVALRNTTDRNERLPDNCGSTAVVASATDTEFTVGCRAFARDYGYAPLRGISDDDELMRPAAAIVKRVSIDGSGTFYAAATPVENRFNVFGVNIVLLVPEADVVGGIYRARNMTLAIVSCVLVLAVLCAFAASHAVLAPLAVVSRQMHNTSRLREDGTTGAMENQNLSSMAEIRELQIAYGAMNTAIRSFTRYVPREVVKDLIASGQLCEIAMRPQYCAMLFSDIAGFTSMCERVPVAELSELISIYFARMSAAVMDHDGVVDKYIGDAVMAVWGAPVSTGHEPLKALMAAIAMIRETKVDPIRSTFDRAGELLSIRVGVADGEVLAGNMGCNARMSYTVIGDAVNLAARLESLCRDFGVNILASGTAFHEAEGLVTGRRLRKVAVVGKIDAVPVYEILGLKNSPDAEEIAALKAADDRASNLFNSQSEDEFAMSRSSRRSYTLAHSGTFARRHEDHKARNAAEMLAKLSAHTEANVVVPAALDKHCAFVNVASTLLDDRQPADAIEQLRHADDVCGSDVVANFGNPHVTEQLRDRCEGALRDPLAFDPVLNLVTKT